MFRAKPSMNAIVVQLLVDLFCAQSGWNKTVGGKRRKCLANHARAIIKFSSDRNVLTNKTKCCQHVVLTTDARAKHHHIDGGRRCLFAVARGSDDVTQVVGLRKG